MGIPKVGDTFDDAIMELLYAGSALNMDQELSESFDPSKETDITFIVDKYKWAKHAYDHIIAASRTIQKIQNGESNA